MNCSTSFIRHITSSGVDIYTAIAMAAGALYGPRHGGANEAVIRMLEEIGSKDNIPKIIKEVKERKRVLFGFGHRVYKNYDPRAKIVKKVLFNLFRSPSMSSIFVEESLWLRLLLNWKRSLFLMSTLSAENSILTLTFTVDWSTELWVSLPICTPCFSPFPEWSDGSHIGRNFWPILRTTFTDQGRIILDILDVNLWICQPERKASSRLTQLVPRNRSEDRLQRIRLTDDVIRIMIIS